MDWNFKDWTWTQWKAAGRQAATGAGCMVAGALAMHLISPDDANKLTLGINDIVTGIEQVAKGIGAIAGIVVLFRNTFKSATSASPKEQMANVVTNLSAPQVTQTLNDLADPGGRKKLIDAVSEMKEVKAIVAPEVAADTGPKVVATVGDVARIVPPAAAA